MNIDYDKAEAAKAFAAVCSDAVTAHEFLDASTPEEMSELLNRAGIDGMTALQTVLGLSGTTIQDEETRAVYPVVQLH